MDDVGKLEKLFLWKRKTAHRITQLLWNLINLFELTDIYLLLGCSPDETDKNNFLISINFQF